MYIYICKYKDIYYIHILYFIRNMCFYIKSQGETCDILLGNGINAASPLLCAGCKKCLPKKTTKRALFAHVIITCSKCSTCLSMFDPTFW